MKFSPKNNILLLFFQKNYSLTKYSMKEFLHMEEKSMFQKTPCEDIDCPERAECCTTVRWRISRENYYDTDFKEWWLLHDGARIFEEDGTYYIQWPLLCRNVSGDGLRCTDYENRPKNCRLYACKYMAETLVKDKEANNE
jgi:hypothetical protein